MQTDRQTDRQLIYSSLLQGRRQTDRQAGRQADKQTFRRQEQNQMKYNMLPGEKSPNFFLWFTNTLGKGQVAEDYLNVLGTRARDSEGRPNPAKFRTFWRNQLSVILQKTLKKITRLTGDPSNAGFSIESDLQVSARFIVPLVLVIVAGVFRNK